MAGTRLALRAPWRPATRRVRRARARTLPRHAPRSLAVLAVLTLALGGGWLWLRDSSLEDLDNLPAPEIIAREIVEDLMAALAEFEAVAAALEAAAGSTKIRRDEGGAT